MAMADYAHFLIGVTCATQDLSSASAALVTGTGTARSIPLYPLVVAHVAIWQERRTWVVTPLAHWLAA